MSSLAVSLSGSVAVITVPPDAGRGGGGREDAAAGLLGRRVR